MGRAEALPDHARALAILGTLVPAAKRQVRALRLQTLLRTARTANSTALMAGRSEAPQDHARALAQTASRGTTATSVNTAKGASASRILLPYFRVPTRADQLTVTLVQRITPSV